jgi:PAS domain S-box-containing protein
VGSRVEMEWSLRAKDLMDESFPRLPDDAFLEEVIKTLAEFSRYQIFPVISTSETLRGVIHRTQASSIFKAFMQGGSIQKFILPPPNCILENDIINPFIDDDIIVKQNDVVCGMIPADLSEHVRIACYATFNIALSLPLPIIISDLCGIVRFCNNAMENIRAGDCPLPTGGPISDIFDNNHAAEVLAQNIPIAGHHAHLLGKSVIVDASPLRVENRTIGGIFVFHGDEVLRKIGQELSTTRRQLDEFAKLIEFSFDGTYITDGDGNTLLLNSAYERITGLKREDLIGKNMGDLVKKGVFDQSVAVKVIKTGTPVTLNQTITTGDNKITVLVSGNPLFDENGKLHRVVATIRDMSELTQLQEKLDTIGKLKEQYEEEVRKLKIVSNDINFRSKAMKAVVDLALRLGNVDSTVLLQGESGVGKEVIATLIHRHSLRKDKPFIKINCAAIPENLLESELFGYSRGAFTGANRDGKIGMFEAANGGSVLLDEVGDLPLPLQVKLLRVIQERKIQRIGESKERNIDVRIIAATHRDLVSMISQGIFREDLYYRLNVVPLRIPPLRERKDDIIMLIQHFIEKFCSRHNLEKEMHPSVMPFLIDYAWPGNVRELENIVERMIVTSVGSVITTDDLPENICAVPIRDDGENLRDRRDNMETVVLRKAFLRYRSTSKVAEALGIHRSNVVRKAKKLGLNELLGRRNP